MSTTMTVRLEDDVKDRLDVLAEATQRSKSFLAAEAIRVFVENNEWQIGENQAALEGGRRRRLRQRQGPRRVGQEVEGECGLGGCARRCATSTTRPPTSRPTTPVPRVSLSNASLALWRCSKISRDLDGQVECPAPAS